ncbi:hypothetical protein OGY18_20590, partial [Citrobacter sp. Cpo142]|nr:hypothetical protein [Citrobacter sp. Cpo142]
SAQIREILISESAWEEMTCLFAPSLKESCYYPDIWHIPLCFSINYLCFLVYVINTLWHR